MKVLILMTLSLLSTFAVANDYEFRCQLTTGDCGYNGGRYGIYITASNRMDAENICSQQARSRGDRLCQVTIEGRAPEEDQYRTYRCQTATEFCGYNGGRHGTYITAINQSDAMYQCMEIARRSGEEYCQVE